MKLAEKHKAVSALLDLNMERCANECCQRRRRSSSAAKHVGFQQAPALPFESVLWLRFALGDGKREIFCVRLLALGGMAIGKDVRSNTFQPDIQQFPQPSKTVLRKKLNGTHAAYKETGKADFDSNMVTPQLPPSDEPHADTVDCKTVIDIF